MVQQITRRGCIESLPGLLLASSLDGTENQWTDHDSRAHTHADWPIEWLESRAKFVLHRHPSRKFTRRQLAYKLSVIEEAETSGMKPEELVDDPHIFIHGAPLLSALGNLQCEGVIRAFDATAERSYQAKQDQ